MTPRTLRTNFPDKEIYCKCGCGRTPVDHAIISLQNLRHLCGFSLEVTSGSRCATHNKAVGGAKESRHIVGDAFDISCVDEARRWDIVKYAIASGFTHIRIDSKFVHIDKRPGICKIGLYK